MSNKSYFSEAVVEEDSDVEMDGVSDEEDASGSEISDEKLPVLKSIVKGGKISIDSNTATNEDAERLAIRQELSALSFEELQKLKEKIGSKKFNQTINGTTKRDVKKEFKRANPNRPREMSSKSRRIEVKAAVQIPKIHRNDPRFDSLCGEFHEQVFFFELLWFPISWSVMGES